MILCKVINKNTGKVHCSDSAGIFLFCGQKTTLDFEVYEGREKVTCKKCQFYLGLYFIDPAREEEQEEELKSVFEPFDDNKWYK